ncbi:DUF2330 domain-containing protein [Candidatus Bathyarchaeota archaeon]|nr:DUF2330 domain-containing protein [Candidatus Bathyarchaeota archaeon]
MPKKYLFFFLLPLLFIGFFSQLVYADRGMIPVIPTASVYEPGQKAIIAWNGHEEIMILSTDVSADQETVVLEVLPLPAEPKVEIASFTAFEEIQRLIWEEGMNQFMYSSEGEARSKSVDVVFHEKIGSHNITVVKANDTSELVEWMEDFLIGSGINGEITLADYETAIDNYMGRGFRYYVLDIIIVNPEEKSVNPILYRFDSDFLYYPLVISSPIKGDTHITLFLLTENKIDKDYFPLQNAYYKTYDHSGLILLKPIQFALSKGDLSKIDLRIAEIFQDLAWLTVLQFNGKLGWLTRDFMISEDAPITDNVTVEVNIPWNLLISYTLLGAVCTLAGVASTFLIMRKKQRE